MADTRSRIVISREYTGVSDVYVSDEYVERGDYDAVMVEVWGSGECSVEILDSPDPASGYSACADQGQGLVTSLITGNTKFWVSSVMDFVKASLTIYATGRWSVRLTPCWAPTPQSIILRPQQARYGAIMAPLRDVAGTVKTIISTPETLYGLHIENNQSAVAYVQLFNALAANVTLGTTSPRLEYRVDANSQMNIPFPAVGAYFSVAITVASTTAAMGATGSAAGVHVFPMYG